MSLKDKHCVPCQGGVEPFDTQEVEEHLKQLQGWVTQDHQKINKEFRFKDFDASMAFVDAVASLAKQEDHHPDIFISYARVVITLWTHKIKGLHQNDFILAAKIDGLYK
jgi:4a-hydroxytetrahydrobiopterin dehydratase